MVRLPPPRTTELYYDGQWNTAPVLERSAVTISRGVSAEGSRAEPTAGSMLLDNRSGDYSPRNPNSPLYGAIGRNTPLRFSVDAGGPYLDLPAGVYSVSTPDAAALDVLGDIDIRVDVAPNSWDSPQMLALRWGAGGHFHWALALHQDGQLVFWWSPTGLDANKRWAISSAAVPAHTGERLAVRVTLDVDNGSGGCTATFSYAKTLETEAWTLIGDPVTPTGSGTTSLFNATGALYLGDNQLSLTPDGTSGIDRLRGKAHGLRVYDGIDGTLKVDVDTARDADVAGTGFTDATGRVWSVTGTASLSNRHTRLVGEVPAWPPERNLSGADRTVPIEPTGITRRLGIGNKPLDSALRRYIAGNAQAVECWPLTDGPDSTSGAALLGGRPMVYGTQYDQDPPAWGDGTVADWIEPVVSLSADNSTGRLTGSLTTQLAAMAGGWCVDHVRSGPGEVDSLFMYDWGAGTDAQNRHIYQLLFQAPLDKILILRESVGTESSSGASLGSIEAAGIFDGRPHHVRFSVHVSSGTTNWAIYLDGVERATGSVALTTRALRTVQYDWGVGDQELALGYFTCWNPPTTAPSASEVYDALLGFPGETAGERMLRVAAEQSVPLSVSGALSDQVALGTQRQERFLDALQSAALSDRGYVLEQRDDRALVYRARSTLYNQSPILTLDWTDGVIGAPFRPTDDDKDTQNDVTVQRQGGSRGYAVLEEGRMSVLDPPDGVGRYDREHTLSLAEDAQADQLASWIMHTGTYDGLRVTSITLKFGNARVYAMADRILRLDVGDKIRLTNLPAAQYGPDDVDLLVRGYSETIGEDWSITFNCTPADPYDVLQLDAGEASRLDTAGSELVAAIDTDDTTLTVATTQGPVWIDSATYPGDMPFDIRVGGEVMTVSAVAQAAVDAFGRTVANGWGSADSGQAWAVSGGVASDFAVTGGTGRQIHSTAGLFRTALAAAPAANVDLRADVSLGVVPTGAAAYAFLMARYTDSTHAYLARLHIAAGGAMTLSLRKRDGTETQLATFATGLTYTAGAWYTMRLSVQGNSLAAKVWLRTRGEPPNWQVTATDSALTAAGSIGVRTLLDSGITNPLPVTFQVDNLLWNNPQVFTVARSINGVIKAHTAGAAVELARPNFIPL
jgi:hypothetical protein